MPYFVVLKCYAAFWKVGKFVARSLMLMVDIGDAIRRSDLFLAVCDGIGAKVVWGLCDASWEERKEKEDGGMEGGGGYIYWTWESKLAHIWIKRRNHRRDSFSHAILLPVMFSEPMEEYDTNLYLSYVIGAFVHSHDWPCIRMRRVIKFHVLWYALHLPATWRSQNAPSTWLWIWSRLLVNESHRCYNAV